MVRAKHMKTVLQNFVNMSESEIVTYGDEAMPKIKLNVLKR